MKISSISSRWFLLGALALALAACEEPEATRERGGPAPRGDERAAAREPLEPLPEPPVLDARRVALGRRLFHDTRLSTDDSVACSSCHDLARGGDDGVARSVGVKQRSGSINAPSVYNAALNFAQFWDGRARTLEEQI